MVISNMRHSFETEDAFVTYEETEEIKDTVFDFLISFFRKYEFFNGETLYQCDEGQIESPSVLAELLDNVFKFDVNYKDELN